MAAYIFSLFNLTLNTWTLVDNSGSSLISLDFTYNVVFRNRESNPGRGGEINPNH